ncbi:hypothetical protein [Parablautia intestinalis]|jgi:hypothetical protein|uniref:hypothetical protein n=1 Tax=Parablautia intestinalis TaxID=2320100 RepID=UPI00256F2EF4|nr:hypothetical protein [Parablautia intestinalis]
MKDILPLYKKPEQKLQDAGLTATKICAGQDWRPEAGMGDEYAGSKQRISFY